MTMNDGNKDLELTEGLREYVSTSLYRRALKLPDNLEEEYHLLAQGEYNRNYVFVHPFTGRKLVLRINYGSQMHLEHQMEYEYQALKLLECSGRTPKPLYVDGSRKEISNGIMVMEYLQGHPMDYKTELFRAADILADVHGVVLPEKHGLVTPDNPVKAILEECEAMVKKYEESPLAPQKKKKFVRKLLSQVWRQAEVLASADYKCCINTELNSTNFLISDEGKRDYLIDWEKPICGEPAQDLGHFLAPTTTFWKTDVILDELKMRDFTEAYIRAVDGRFPVKDLWERTCVYMTVTCLRGITWCAMAWVEYQEPGRELINESTRIKLEAYLSDGFLERIEKFIEHTC